MPIADLQQDLGQGVQEETERRSVEQQTIALLKSEIEALQAELAEKDILATPFVEGDANDNAQQESDSQIVRYTAELEESDQRIANLDAALRASEEAMAANDAERRELLNWVEEIETRVGEQEDQWRAERGVLDRRIQDELDRYNLLMKRFEDIDQGEPSFAFQESIEVLRNENNSLHHKLTAKQQEYGELQQRFEELSKANREEQIQRRVADQIREERLQLAQERAVFSRQKLELTKRLQLLQQELEMRDRKEHPADQKFRAFREQLKELHQQEQAEYVPPTLTQKLKRIWDRLDGPTDRD